MKRYLYIFICSLILISSYSCKEANSDLNQITAKTFECYPNKSRAIMLYEKYGKNNPNITVNSKEAAEFFKNYFHTKKTYPTTARNPEQTKLEAFEKLSHVPEEYLEYVFKTRNIPVRLVTYGTTTARYAGFTLKNSDSYYIPTSIISHPMVLVHEFGHASKGYIWEKLNSEPEDQNSKLNPWEQFLSDLESMRATLSPEKVSSYLRRQLYYTTTNEVFAELFDTWYCSEEARDFLGTEDGIPEAYKFAKKYLLDPK